MEFPLSIFTLNCWAIPIVSKDRKERILALVAYLNKSEHDIVCLQEIWSENDFIYIRDNLSVVFPYSHYFYSGVLGSGLCVFSKWIIQDVFFHQWPLNGYIHKIHHGDWFGGKGVGLCRIKMKDKLINVYNTHLHAEYHVDDIYLAHRVLQAHATAELVNLTYTQADISIIAGDLNTAPGDLSFRILSELASLLDPLNQRIEGTNSRIRIASGTSDNANNSYSDQKQTQKTPEGKRIDHILFRAKAGWEVKVLNYGNPLEDRVPGKLYSYSDHNAVTLQLILTPNKNTKPALNTPIIQEVVQEAIKVCEEAKTTLNKTKKLYLTIGGALIMFMLGTVGYWPNNIISDVIKIVITVLSFYNLVMGTIWNKIELNSIKSSESALCNYERSLQGARFNFE